MKPFLAIIPIMLIVSGCVSKRTYDRDIARLTSQLQAERGETGSSMTSIESRLVDKSRTLAELTDRYIKLQAEKKRASQRLNTFRGDIEELQRDISELKLVVGKNVEKFPSTTANEMLIKLIDMEYRVQELLRKEAEEAPPLEGLTGEGTEKNEETVGGGGGDGGGGGGGSSE
jgi:chromosome segregation ATPase